MDDALKTTSDEHPDAAAEPPSAAMADSSPRPQRASLYYTTPDKPEDLIFDLVTAPASLTDILQRTWRACLMQKRMAPKVAQLAMQLAISPRLVGSKALLDKERMVQASEPPGFRVLGRGEEAVPRAGLLCGENAAARYHAGDDECVGERNQVFRGGQQGTPSRKLRARVPIFLWPAALPGCRDQPAPSAACWLRQVALTAEPSDDGATARIRIIDSGIGMTEAGLERLFKPFSQASRPSQPEPTHGTAVTNTCPSTQAEDSTKSKYGGHGLGLLISRNICRAMQGELAISTDGPGRGCTVTVTVPLLPPSATAIAARAGVVVDSNGGSPSLNPVSEQSSGGDSLGEQSSGGAFSGPCPPAGGRRRGMRSPPKRQRLLLAEDDGLLRKVLQAVCPTFHPEP